MADRVVPALPTGWRSALPGSRTPLTIAYLLALAVTSATLAGARPRTAFQITLDSSTNLHNLATHPLDVLFTSAFWLESGWWFFPMAALVLAALPRAERRWGSWRTAGLFATGHVLATLIVVGVIAVGIEYGWASRRLSFAVDVGPSYGLLTVWSALLWRVPPHRYRRPFAVLLLAVLCGYGAVGDFTDAGHVVAFLIGLLSGHLALEFTRARRRLHFPGRHAVPSQSRGHDGHDDHDEDHRDQDKVAT